jgi:hypothetical protein
MSIVAVQGSIGAVGSKPLTEVTGYNFESIATINGNAIGVGNGGIYQLNEGDTFNGSEYTRAFVINQTDFGLPGNLKKLRYVYIAMRGGISSLKLSISADERGWCEYCRCTTHGRGVRVAVGSREKGIYWSFKVESKEFFRIDNIDVLFIPLNSGISQC